MAPPSPVSFFVVEQYPVHLPPRAFDAEIEGSLRVSHSFCQIASHYQMSSKPLLGIYCWGQNIDLLNVELGDWNEPF